MGLSLGMKVRDLLKKATKLKKENKIEEAAKTMKECCGENKEIIYGGSINSSNCTDILKLTEIDGALVGGASLNPKEFAMIAQSC